MGGELGVSRATDVAEVEGAPTDVLHALGAGVAWGGVGTRVQMGIPADFCLSLPVPLVNVLYQMLPLVKCRWLFYKHK